MGMGLACALAPDPFVRFGSDGQMLSGGQPGVMRAPVLDGRRSPPGHRLGRRVLRSRTDSCDLAVAPEAGPRRCRSGGRGAFGPGREESRGSLDPLRCWRRATVHPLPLRGRRPPRLPQVIRTQIVQISIERLTTPCGVPAPSPRWSSQNADADDPHSSPQLNTSAAQSVIARPPPPPPRDVLARKRLKIHAQTTLSISRTLILPQTVTAFVPPRFSHQPRG